ncbi:MAG: hypothetical protein II247_00650 [Lachnospiraceae bacterium]|nr:hypothetical protein [Lachnospiraceae bacterium]
MADNTPLEGFSFVLRVEGIFDLPCRAIKNLRRENEFDYIQEGGVNDYVHIKRKAISKPFTFQVERYAGSDYSIGFGQGASASMPNFIDPLPLGAELILPVMLFVYKDMSTVARTYVFTGCTVTGKDYGELNAEKSELVVDTITIAYREMICLDTTV